MDKFGEKIKYYEKRFLNKVSSNFPIIVRIDGKSFHNWTKPFKKPFDEKLSNAFQHSTKKVCENVGQIIIAYSQSDEVIFLLNGWQNPESQIYFGGKVQKIVSVMTSMFTGYFNEYFNIINTEHYFTPAFFDARVFNVPASEIKNVFIWRKMDAKRNSIQSFARFLYGHKELYKKNTNEMLEMIRAKGYEWNDLPNIQKWGFIVKKEKYIIGENTVRTKWVVDTEVPDFNDIILT